MNISQYIEYWAQQYPDKQAIIFYKANATHGGLPGVSLSFKELKDSIDAFAHGLRSVGIQKACRVVLMVRPSLEYLPLTFALFKIGAIPVLIDPGMGRKNLFPCIQNVQAHAFIGIPLAHIARLCFQRYFHGIKIHITLGRRLFWGGYSLKHIYRPQPGAATPVETRGDDMAAIIFTTGSTGPPKGVIYTHTMFDAQHRILRDTFSLNENDIDMPGFILFAIFSLMLGMTVVIPEMDPTRPANVNPKIIIDTIRRYEITFSFGSPALWNTVSQYCHQHRIRLPFLRKVIMAGAPVSDYLHERLLHHVLRSDATTYTPYGATEALPVSSITGQEIMTETALDTQKGRGYCLGKILSGIDLKIIQVHDHPIRSLDHVKILPVGEIGEIIVKGPNVSASYFDLNSRTEWHKIHEEPRRKQGLFWHRMGDLGYLDENGRLWFCGRMNHRVETGKQRLLTVCCEAIFNQHPAVDRSALVGIGPDRYRQTPVMIIESRKEMVSASRKEIQRRRNELLRLGRENALTRVIQEILFHPELPVDIRHNAKIHREELTRWAAKKRRSNQ